MLMPPNGFILQKLTNTPEISQIFHLALIVDHPIDLNIYSIDRPASLLNVHVYQDKLKQGRMNVVMGDGVVSFSATKSGMVLPISPYK